MKLVQFEKCTTDLDFNDYYRLLIAMISNDVSESRGSDQECNTELPLSPLTSWGSETIKHKTFRLYNQ